MDHTQSIDPVQFSPIQSSITVALHAWPSALIAVPTIHLLLTRDRRQCALPCKNFYIETGAASIREMYYLRQPGTDQDKHIRYVKSRRFQKLVEGVSKGMQKRGSVIQSFNPVGLVSIVRWRHLPHSLLLFFFSARAGIGPADELP
jgi:hypothetical protein